jgi:hypothetical protein
MKSELEEDEKVKFESSEVDELMGSLEKKQL